MTKDEVKDPRTVYLCVCSFKCLDSCVYESNGEQQKEQQQQQQQVDSTFKYWGNQNFKIICLSVVMHKEFLTKANTFILSFIYILIAWSWSFSSLWIPAICNKFTVNEQPLWLNLFFRLSSKEIGCGISH